LRIIVMDVRQGKALAVQEHFNARRDNEKSIVCLCGKFLS